MFRNLVRLSLVALFIAGFTLGIRAIAPGPSAAPDYDGATRGKEITIHVDEGMTGSELGKLLYENGVVKSSLAYFRAAVADPRSERIAPGEHRIERRIPAREAIEQLLDPDRIVNLIRIRDGARLSEIIDEIEKAGFKRNAIESAIRSFDPPAPFKLKSSEGFLYPAFYSVTKDATLPEVLGKMTGRFKSATEGIDWKYREFSPDEILTIASLVQAEGTPDIFGKVAAVIYNRLETGMRLQFDSTVHFIFDRRGEIALSISDTKVKNPYNTFQNQGLPPGPIGSPTRAAIEAALNPESGKWLYFVTVLPGETRFTDSYNEFLGFKAEYKRNYRNGAFEK